MVVTHRGISGVGEPCVWLCGVGEGLQGDPVAEGFELSDRACPYLGGYMPAEVVGAGIAVEVAGAQHVPGGDEHRRFDGDKGFQRAASGGDPLVLRRKVGSLGTRRRQCGSPQGVHLGSRVTKAPGDLESQFHWNGDVFTDGQLIDTITPKHGNTKVNNTPAIPKALRKILTDLGFKPGH